MNWKQMDEMEQKASRPTPPRSRWLRYRKWLMIPGIILAGFLIFQVQNWVENRQEILEYGHACELPKPGDSWVAYDGGRSLQRIVRVLDEQEEVPSTSNHWNAEFNEETRNETRRKYEDIYTLLHPNWGKYGDVYCEVECFHIADTICEANWSDDPIEKDLYTLAEYRVIRVFAEKPHAEGKVKAGDIISTFDVGNSTIQYYGNEPYKEGDRFVLVIQSMDRVTFTDIPRPCVLNSEFYIVEKLKLSYNEETGTYTTKKPVRLIKYPDDGTLKIVGETDSDDTTVDQLGAFAQQRMKES